MFSALGWFQQSQREFQFLSAEEDSTVVCLAQTLFPMNSAATVTGKKKEKNEVSKVLVACFFFFSFGCYFCGYS